MWVDVVDMVDVVDVVDVMYASILCRWDGHDFHLTSERRESTRGCGQQKMKSGKWYNIKRHVA